MKASRAFVASVLAASTVALSSTSISFGDRDVIYAPCSNQESLNSSVSSTEKGRTKNLGWKGSREKDKFAPRFDGLRFIETLVTAHR